MEVKVKDLSLPVGASPLSYSHSPTLQILESTPFKVKKPKLKKGKKASPLTGLG